MKAKDLMIGDLVYYLHTEDGIAPYKEVICIQAEDLCRDACIIETHYEPIPLTAEILEKNFPEPTDGITWYPEEGGFNCHTYVPDCEINAFGLFEYVHQLQHALRLCEIEKEIII